MLRIIEADQLDLDTLAGITGGSSNYRSMRDAQVSPKPHPHPNPNHNPNPNHRSFRDAQLLWISELGVGLGLGLGSA